MDNNFPLTSVILSKPTPHMRGSNRKKPSILSEVALCVPVGEGCGFCKTRCFDHGRITRPPLSMLVIILVDWYLNSKAHWFQESPKITLRMVVGVLSFCLRYLL
jgi:hypothetical protein